MAGAVTRKETDLWLLERLAPGLGVNNLSVTFDVDGAVDTAALSRAVTLVVRRHDVLRTVFDATEEELTKRVLAPDEVSVPVEEIDIGTTRPHAATAPAPQPTPDSQPASSTQPAPGAQPAPDDVRTATEAFLSAPFALDGSLLVRAALVRHTGTDTGTGTGTGTAPDAGPDADADTDRSTVCVALHHLVFDAMSTATLVGELVAAHEAPDAYAAAPVVPAAVEPEPPAEHIAFWRDHLRRYRGDSGLWFGRPGALSPDLAGGTLRHELSREAQDVVRRLQRTLRAPEAVILLAAYYLLLARHGAGRDMVVGSPVSVRPPGREGAIGYHVNVMPLRVRADLSKPFKRLVNRARGVFLEGLGHSGVPAESVLDEVRAPTSSSWRNPLFSHLFNYVPVSDDAAFGFGGRPARMRDVENGFSKYDLEFFFLSGNGDTGGGPTHRGPTGGGPAADGPEGGAPDGGRIQIRAVYRTCVFRPYEVGLLLARYDALLCALGADPDRPVGQVPLFCAADRAALPEGSREYVADPAGTVLPIGVRGRLYRDGSGTGEVARLLPGGGVEILGLMSRQVTVEGVRFGLEETEAVLAAQPGVGAAATVAVPPQPPEIAGAPHGDGAEGAESADMVLVSFVSPVAPGSDPASAAQGLREQLEKAVRTELPGPMQPARIVVFEGLPMMNGAPDLEGLRLRAQELLRTERRQRAQEQRHTAGEAGDEAEVDIDALTEELLVLWKEFLKRDGLTVDSGFFAHGGHSLLAVQLLQRMRRTLNIRQRVRLADLFAHPTPERLSAFIAERESRPGTRN